MIFRQLFDKASSTYTYLLACEQTREAILIDPVKEQLAQYLQLLRELDLTLLYAADTHTHADHITALGALRDATGCVTLMGEFTQAGCVSRGLKDGEIFKVGALSIQALYTPGHTDESFSFVLNPTQPAAVFTGDTLLIRGFSSCPTIPRCIQAMITRAGPYRPLPKKNAVTRDWQV